MRNATSGAPATWHLHSVDESIARAKRAGADAAAVRGVERQHRAEFLLRTLTEVNAISDLALLDLEQLERDINASVTAGVDKSVIATAQSKYKPERVRRDMNWEAGRPPAHMDLLQLAQKIEEAQRLYLHIIPSSEIDSPAMVSADVSEERARAEKELTTYAAPAQDQST
jgi:hypothetical protein